jgi:RHS repeat-associated protein
VNWRSAVGAPVVANNTPSNRSTHLPISPFQTRPFMKYSRHAFLVTALIALSLVVVSNTLQAATLTRTSTFSYEAASGHLLKEIIEPSSSNLCLVTSYTLDTYGNRTAGTVRNCNGSAGEAAAPTGDAVFVSRTSSNTFDSHGQFPLTSTNALNQSESQSFDSRTGAALSLTGPNALTTGWAYDDFGRKILERRADGTGTQWSYLYCSGINGGTQTCPTVGSIASSYVLVSTPVASVDLVAKTAGAANGAISKTYYDALNRELRSETQGFDGTGTSTAIYQDTQYDNLGRPYKTSRPYYASQAVYWTTLTYDALNRVTNEALPDGTSSLTSYSGLIVISVNANNQARTTIRNSQGQIVSVTDAQNQTISYSYDPFGNLIQTTDSVGNQVKLTYDLRGRKTGLQDPDLGTWSYAYDALSQLIRQTDAKAQVTTLSYDAIGRQTNRSEADLVSSWYFDTYKGGAACPKGIGKLCQAETSTGYNRTHSYDPFGRPAGNITTIDASYSTSASYDSNGRIATQTYPTGVAPTALTVKYVYTALGYLKEVRDNTSNALYWSANTLDAEGHLLAQTYGNNVQTQQTYNPANGRVTNIIAGAGSAVQNLSYSSYDPLGNLWTRNDGNQYLTETFTYDSLNRLKTSTVNSSGAGTIAKSISYDGIGNVTNRSELGSYTYPASGTNSTRPHALTRVDLANGDSLRYSYDANGNQSAQDRYNASNTIIAGQSRTTTYTSFNMPNTMTSASATTTWFYGTEHQRVKETSTTQGTTIYLNPGSSGDLAFEKDIKPNGTIEQRNFISAYGQVIAVMKQTQVAGNTTNSVRYFHRDNLGSVTAITDENGNLPERLAYEPFGKRRFPAGQDDPTNSIAAQTTDRGFTNHEHIEEFALIHMNGRVYDPAIGRFISADPNVPDAFDMQSFSRYSYVLNNPLGYTDPSGFADEIPRVPVTGCDAACREKWIDNYESGSYFLSNRVDLFNSTLGFDKSLPTARLVITAPRPKKQASFTRLVNSYDNFLTGSYGQRAEMSRRTGDYLGWFGNEAAGVLYGMMNLATLGEGAAVAAALKSTVVGTEKTIYVIGRQADTAVAENWTGHSVLNIENWTLAKNDQFIDRIIFEKAPVYLGSPQIEATLWDAANNRMTVYARELEQLLAAGYKQVGDYLILGR